MSIEVFCPTPGPDGRYTMQDALKVMADTARLFSAPRPATINARAAATKTSPARAASTKTKPDATEAFFTAVGETMDAQGLRKHAAIRAVAIARPDLHRAYLVQFNTEHQAKRTREMDRARALARRNRRK